MKKVLMTLTNGRACSHSTKRTSSFCARLIAALAAVLCCAMTTTVFTACSTDSNNDEGANDKTPKYMMMEFYIDNTEDMLKYCNIEITIEDQLGNKKSTVLTSEYVDADYVCYATANGELPTTFKFTRKVTLKQSIDNLESFKYTTRTKAEYGIFNAAGYQIGIGETDVVGETGTVKGTEAAQLIKQGVLDYTRTFKYDEKGNLIPENNTAQ